MPDKYQITNLPEVKNQKNVSSCVAHVLSSILEYHDAKDNKSHTLSTNFIYGIQHKLFDTDTEGMKLRDACKIVKEYGDMLETDCSGNNEVPECWSIAETALSNESAANNAKYFCVGSYYSCKTNDAIKKAIYKYGPVLGAIKWYDTFKPNGNGVLKGEQSGDYGYHAIMIYGWNETGFLCQNSWGMGWGNKGRFTLPYEIPVAEAKALIDSGVDIDQKDVTNTTQSKWLKLIYKIFNEIINTLKRLFNKD